MHFRDRASLHYLLLPLVGLKIDITATIWTKKAERKIHQQAVSHGFGMRGPDSVGDGNARHLHYRSPSHDGGVKRCCSSI